MAHVTSGKLQKEFGRYRTMAHSEPVVVTNHGRDDLVLISATEYKRLRRLDVQSLPVSELSSDELNDLENVVIPTEASQYNNEVK